MCFLKGLVFETAAFAFGITTQPGLLKMLLATSGLEQLKVALKITNENKNTRGERSPSWKKEDAVFSNAYHTLQHIFSNYS